MSAEADLATIAVQGEVLERLEAAAERLLAAGKAEDAAACAVTAGRIAWFNHPGRFASPRLEAVLCAAGAVLDGEPAPGPPPAPGTVLHVLTEAYAAGGHTNIVRQWVRLDTGRRHRVLATNQSGELGARLGELPPEVEVLTPLSPADPLLGRALALRAAAAGAECVVLHVHPFDALPLLAFPPGTPRPPIVFSNHADHCFWLGRGLADVIVDHRPAGTAIAVERRGIEPERCTHLPLPPAVTEGEGAAGRSATRASLGVPQDAVLVLTVGSPYKYAADPGRHLAELVSPVVARNRRAIVLAVGPPDEGPWRDARVRTGKRVQALGPVTGLGPLYAAADVYLESYPCSGATCLSEAAIAGLPVLSFAPDADEAEILGTTPSERFQRAGDVAGYRRLLERLVSSAAERRRWSEQSRAWAAESCDPEPWLAALEAVYERLGAVAPAVAADPAAWPAEEPGARDVQVHRLHVRPGHGVPADLAERMTAQLELASRSSELRVCFDRLIGDDSRPELRRTAGVAVAAPPVDDAALALLVAELRRLLAAGVVDGCAITVAPEALDAAVAILEPLIDAAGDLPVELVPAADPAALLGPRILALRQLGDAWGDAPAEAGTPEHQVPHPAVSSR